MDILTAQQLKDMAPGTVFASGEIENSPAGIYMTDSNVGKMLRWVARRGRIDDWAIYTYWAEYSVEYCLDFGQKVSNNNNIKNLVPCDQEALARYRK